jgi:hypothetical protein
LIALSTAKEKGVPHDAAALKDVVELLRRDAANSLPLSSEPTFHPSPASATGYLLWGLSLESTDADFSIDALVHAAAVNQSEDGSWLQFIPRPPITDVEISSTALGVRALTLYPLPGRKEEMEARVGRARAWLSDSSPRMTEEHVYKILGLYWAGEPREKLAPLVEELARQQRKDGGWAQLPSLESDAYATGQALYVLGEVGGLGAADDAVRKGLAYLVRTQMDDGSWYVRRRAYPFQPTMDPKFPHGRDAWISAAATSWAVVGLSTFLDKQAVLEIVAAGDPVAPAGGAHVAARLPKPAERKVDFDTDVLPILENSCLSCHSSSAPAGQYALDTRASLIKGGFSGPPVVIPGNSADSALIHHVAGLIEDVEMPPLARRDEYEALSDGEISLLRAWIDQGLPGLTE